MIYVCACVCVCRCGNRPRTAARHNTNWRATCATRNMHSALTTCAISSTTSPRSSTFNYCKSVIETIFEQLVCVSAVCVQGLQFYAGIERYDPTVCDAVRWAAASAATLQRSQSERAKAVQMLSGENSGRPLLT